MSLHCLPDLIGENGIFVDGDWVESKDQDPNGDVRLVQLADIGEGEFLDKSARFLTSQKASELRCTYLEPGDILIARMPDPLGRACIFPGDTKPCVTVVDVCIVRIDEKIVDRRWLLHKINSPEFRSLIETFASGTTRKRISRKNLGKLEFLLPPLGEQQRITAVLDKADALRAKRRAALAKLDTLLQATFLHMFGDPVTNPMGWPVVKLGTLASHVGSGATPRGGSSVYDVEGFLFIRSQNVLMFDFDFSDAAYIEEGIHDNMQRSKVRNNDVLLNITGASIGRVNYFLGTDDSANVNQHVCIIRPKTHKIMPEFLTYHLGAPSYQSRILGQNAGATRQAFNFRQIKEFQIMLPPLKQQHNFSLVINRFRRLRNRHIIANSKLDFLFHSLQQRAFKGEL